MLEGYELGGPGEEEHKGFLTREEGCKDSVDLISLSCGQVKSTRHVHCCEWPGGVWLVYSLHTVA